MTRIMASETGLTEIGYLGESGHRVITFHDSIDLLKKYPQATVTILHQRKGDDIAYAVDSQYVSTANGIVEWTIQSADVAVAGYPSRVVLKNVWINNGLRLGTHSDSVVDVEVTGCKMPSGIREYDAQYFNVTEWNNVMN